MEIVQSFRLKVVIFAKNNWTKMEFEDKNIAFEGYKVELYTASEEHWRYNIGLSISRRDELDEQIGFVSHFDRVAATVANLAERPIEVDDVRHIELSADDCPTIVVAVYVIAHTMSKVRRLLPQDKAFAMRVTVSHNGVVLYNEPLMVDLWGGANAIIRVDGKR